MMRMIRHIEASLAYAKLGLIVHQLIVFKESHRGRDLLALLDRIEATIQDYNTYR